MKILWQYLLPRLGMTRLFGWLATIQVPWIKNYFIKRCIKKYQIDLSIAERTSVNDYQDFNDFFTRRLRPLARAIDSNKDALISPVDGYLYQFGITGQNPVLQAKGFEYSLQSLLVEPLYVELMQDSQFFCIYLSPSDYHRTHIPIAGRLLEMTYVPGDYYSVNPEVLAKIPGVFAKNERLICLFETAIGPMIYIMVGAMCVSSIHTIWSGRVNAERNGAIIRTNYRSENIYLEKAAELGYFQMGSTVMVFLPKDKLSFDSNLAVNQHCLLGQKIGTIQQTCASNTLENL